MDITALLAIIVPLIGTGVVWAWNKWGKKISLIKDIVSALEDGELTKEEADKIIADIRKILGK